jgi:RNA polymerase sigma factor (sigma-70 family)
VAVDHDLVERARGGDHAAFDALVVGTIGRLDGAARLILRDPESARDAVQEAFARAWRDLPGLRDVDRFDAWLHRLLVRACYDEVRRRRRHPVAVEITVLHHPAVSDSQAASADRDALERALGHLEPDLRALVVLFYYLDLPLAAAADAAGIPLGTAKSRLHRARTELRAALGAPPAGASLIAEGQA